MFIRRMLAAATAVALSFTAACSSTDDSPAPQETTGQQTTAASVADTAPEESAFPVTIEHKFGSTTIESAPQRVVSLGYTDQDPLLALGVTPVSVHYWTGMTPDGQAAGNWANDLIDGDQPRIDKDAELNLEAIAKDRPDLIVAVYSDIDQDAYDKLSKIAPTVAQKGEYNTLQQPWDVTTMEIGEAVGKADLAATKVKQVKDKFAAVKSRHPEWQGKTLGVVSVGQDQLYVFSEDDPRARFFRELGFTINPAYKDIVGENFYGEVSLENVDRAESDVMVWDQLSYSPNGDKTTVTDSPIFSSIPAVADGRSVYLEDEVEKAFGWQTVLSLDYVLDQIEQPLAEVAGK